MLLQRALSLRALGSLENVYITLAKLHKLDKPQSIFISNKNLNAELIMLAYCIVQQQRVIAWWNQV